MSTGQKHVVIIGGGPSGLMAAEALAQAGHAVTVCDAMPSPGRKFLLAGIGGLNLTHSEPQSAFVGRYTNRQDVIAPLLEQFGSNELRAWASALGTDTFVGTSGRVFPTGMKAAPLLRAWLHRLRTLGVNIRAKHRWLGWRDASQFSDDHLRFSTPSGEVTMSADALVLALGGGSWARLGSDGKWVSWLSAKGVRIAPLRPANCGFDIGSSPSEPTGWSAHFIDRFAGQPLKSVVASFTDASGTRHERAGECLISKTGLEGSLIYALSAHLRDTIETIGVVELTLDLAPGRSLEQLADALSRPRGSRSLASHLKSKAGISGVKANLLRERASPDDLLNPARLAYQIKHLKIMLTATRPIDEAISTAGGVCFEALDDNLMLSAQPGIFCCGEMLDWEAPTGGYLLTACFATGRAAGLGAAQWLGART